MSLLNRFIKNIKQQNLFQKNDYLLLAVSGGADSVVLCALCHQAGFHFEIAHCNFQLRGEESERDEQFVIRLAKKYGVKLFLKKFETKTYAEQHKVSIEVAARELRYKWFEELLKDDNRQPVFNHQPSTYLLTAHHANDNIETLLMNFFKGTGIRGLRGMLPRQGKIIRPMLFAKREEIISFINENNLEFVEDSSNSSDIYTRNYFRNQLIPSIQKVFPKAEDNLVNNMEKFREMETLYDQSIQLHRKKLIEQKGNEIQIPVLKLFKAKPLKTITYEIIKDYGFTSRQTDEAIHLLNSESGKFISSATHKIIRNRNWLIIAPVNTLEANHILINESDIEPGDASVNFELGKIKFSIKNFESKSNGPSKGDSLYPATNEIAMLDLKNITFPLLLRKWKQGDYFYPLGMRGKKKLSRFFIDQKMSLTDKENIWVIESNKRIIWIIGKRIDDRFKITETTKKILLISFVKSAS